MTVRTEFGALLDDVANPFRGSETAKLLAEAGNVLSRRAAARRMRIDNLRQQVGAISGASVELVQGEFESLALLGMAEAAVQERVARWLQRATQKGGE